MKRILVLVFTMNCGIIMVSAQPDTVLLSAEKIVSLIPDKIAGFYPSADTKSRLIKLGTLRYSMVEKNFSANRKRSIKILLFDYKEAHIMYNQATRTWSTFAAFEADSLFQGPTVIKDCSGWESYNVIIKNSQIKLGICDRFFLMVEGTNVDLESLRKIVQEFKFETFPK